MSSPSGFDETRFRKQVTAALDKVRTILETNRAPGFPEDVPHQYTDKYLLAEGLTNNAIAAQLTCLQLLGLTGEGIAKLKKWSNSRTVTIRLVAEESCTFLREVERTVENATKHVTEYSGVFNAKFTDKGFHKVTEYFWRFDCSYEIFVYEGNKPNDKVMISTRSGTHEIKTSSSSSPRPKKSNPSPIDFNMSWLLQNISDQFVLNFAIDRNAKSCHTPRRNSDIEKARSYFQGFHQWAHSVHNSFNTLFSAETGHGYDLGKMTDQGIFIPVVPLFEEPNKEIVAKAIEAGQNEKTLVTVGQSSGALLSMTDCNNFLLEHKRSLEERFAELAKMYPAVPAKEKGKVITAKEANTMVLMLHLKQVSQHFLDGVDYIEHMLRKQLISAIGKEVQPSDFTNYMRYHNRQLFKPEFEPSLFCYAIRRPDHYPEGTVSIEQTIGDAIPESILTSCCKADVVRPMYFSINAATDIYFTGERYLHAWVSHQFSGEGGPVLKLNARARQFSSFIVLLGTIADETQFLPKHAVIIQNKDDLKIPLSLEQLPTPKEFKDSIQSLSPEQQRFARAYRSMQLAQTIFAVCVIQIKPQLEKLLKLDNDSLTKEIKMTQDLLELFITYQIPSDLISYAGDPNASTTQKVDAVKLHINALQEMIQLSRQKEIAQAKQQRNYAGKKRPQGRIATYSEAAVSFPAQRIFSRPTTGSAEVQPPTLQPGDTLGQQPVDLQLNYEPDYTLIPGELDRRFEKLDEDSSLRPTILKIGQTWEKTSQEALLSDPKTSSLNVEQQEDERDRAFDLLDALSRSGCLPIEAAELHVVLAATHLFDQTLMNTVIQQNVNPIEKVERSLLILATTIQNKSASELLREDQIERLKTYSPTLFKEGSIPDKRTPLALDAPKKDITKGEKDKGKRPQKVGK